MAELSRTQKSIRNAKVALFFSMLTFALGFFSRKILMDALGADILGLYTTASNLCGFLNLAELGITSAVAFSLYKPIFDNDRQAITEIVSIQGWLFRYVGIAMTVGAVIMMSLFPVFFNEEKTNLPLWHSFATFGVIFLSQVLGYFFCYQQTLLSADQQEYKITYCFQGGRVLKIVLQIVGIGIFHLNYAYWLIIELVCGILTQAGLYYAIHKHYSWLNTNLNEGKQLLKKHYIIITKIKQLIFHQIASFVLQNTSPLILYAFASLTLVAIYGNYMSIIINIGILTKSCFNNIHSSIGNLVAENNQEKTISFFNSYKALRYWLASLFCFCLYNLATPFMALWFGTENVLDDIALLLLVATTFINCSRNCDAFLSAHGLFSDIWAPMTEATLNIGLSILLGYYWGLHGILLGTLISLWVIVCIWKPIFLYRSGFHISPINYIPSIGWPLLLIASCWTITQYILPFNPMSTDTSVSEFIVSTIVTPTAYCIISLPTFYALNAPFRRIAIQIVNNTILRK